jgi:hypothetical protein
MIRTLALVAAVGFVLSLTCLTAAFAIAGGPFHIDHDLRFHRSGWSDGEAAAGDPHILG